MLDIIRGRLKAAYSTFAAVSGYDPMPEFKPVFGRRSYFDPKQTWQGLARRGQTVSRSDEFYPNTRWGIPSGPFPARASVGDRILGNTPSQYAAPGQEVDYSGSELPEFKKERRHIRNRGIGANDLAPPGMFEADERSYSNYQIPLYSRYEAPMPHFQAENKRHLRRGI
jgi:hypothetical protein